MQKKKQTAACISLILLAQTGFCACQKNNSDSQENSDPENAAIQTATAPDADSPTESPVILPDLKAEFDSWQDAYTVYIDYLLKKSPDKENANANYRYSLIYLDDDDIPELYFLSCSDSTGESIASWSDKQLSVLELSNTNAADYIEKTGLLYHHPAKAEKVTVYELKNGVFNPVAAGSYRWDAEKGGESVETDSQGRPANIYEWESESVSEQEFDQKLNAVYETERSIRPQDWYPTDEMLSVLETGKHISADHRYELIIQDVSWTEAQTLCQEKGGYLATITAPEERLAILELMKQEEKSDYEFFVGYRTEPERWIAADQSEIPAGTLPGFWEYQAPDYNFIEPEFEIQECGILKYYPETDKIYLFSAPDALVSTLPEYAGKIGYICEYDQ